MKTYWLLFVTLFVTLFVSMGCEKIPWPTRSAALMPGDVVKKFLAVSAGASDLKDKKVLSEMCYGEMKRIFERMSDEMFTMSYLSNQVSVQEIKIVESRVHDSVARILYQVTVENKQGTDPTVEKNEREVELTRVDGQWRIDSIRPHGSDQIAFSRGMIF